MSKSALYSKRIEAFQLISIPAGVVTLIALLLLTTKNNTLSLSILMGGLVWLAPNFYFAKKVFSGDTAKITPALMLKNFYQAEVVKLTLCAILFIVIMKFLPVAVLPLLIGFCIAQVTFWVSPFILNKMRRSAK